MVQGREQHLVQDFIAQPTIEAPDEGVLGRLARRDVMPVDLAFICEGQDRVRVELGPVVADHPDRLAAGLEQGPCGALARAGSMCPNV